MKIKKTIAAVAAAAMVFTSVPMVAFAADCVPASITYESKSATQHTGTCPTAECTTHTGAGGKFDEDHDTDGKKAVTGGHVTSCSKCGYAAEDATVTPHIVVALSPPEEGYGKCSACNAKVACPHTDYSAGTGDNAGKRVCDVCGKTADCTGHQWEKDGTAGNKICSVCGEKQVCDHSGGKETSISSANHVVKCKDCEFVFTADGHAIDITGVTATDLGNGKHVKMCKTCGEPGEAGTPHNYSTVVEGSGTATKHKAKCACGAENEVSHTPTFKAGSATADGHKMECTSCKYEETVAHTWTAGSAGTAGHKVCSVVGCAYDGGECDHEYTKWVAASTNHKLVCNTCGDAKQVNSADVTHAAALGDYVSDGAEGHHRVCGYPGCTFTDTDEHSYWTEDELAADATRVKDKCKDCGYVKTTTPEQKPEDKPEQKPEDKPEQKPEETTPTTPAASSGSSSSSSSSNTASTGAAVNAPAASVADVKTANKATVNIDATATKVTPAIVNAFVKNKKTKTMTITYGTTMRIAVSKSDIKNASTALDFSVSGKGFLSSKAMKNATLAKAKKVVQIDFVNKGKIDGVDKVTVQSRVGAKYVGEKATVYEYVDGKLVKIATAKVGGSGLVSFKVDHLGQYVVVVG